ncbi:HTH_Tnp_Tc3_2 domain-containing protein [Trichonephila clavipes]|nr:HTH_Tnp_Tc3_2 domain-containing protein [Trichonephila clavipes]
MPRAKSRNAYQHISDFDKGQIVAYPNYGLFHHNIAARVGQEPMTVSRVWNRCVKDGNTERRAGSQRPPITSNRYNRHVTGMALMDRAATSRVLNQDFG